MSHHPEPYHSCSNSIGKLAVTLFLVLPLGAAVYFWREKCLLERRLRNIEELYGRAKLEERYYRTMDMYDTYPMHSSDIEEGCPCTAEAKRPTTLQDLAAKQNELVEGLCWLARRVEKLKEDHEEFKEKDVVHREPSKEMKPAPRELKQTIESKLKIEPLRVAPPARDVKTKRELKTPAKSETPTSGKSPNS